MSAVARQQSQLRDLYHRSLFWVSVRVTGLPSGFFWRFRDLGILRAVRIECSGAQGGIWLLASVDGDLQVQILHGRLELGPLFLRQLSKSFHSQAESILARGGNLEGTAVVITSRIVGTPAVLARDRSW